MKLDTLAVPAFEYKKEYVIRYMNYIGSHFKHTVLQVPGNLGANHKGDFYGLMFKLRVPEQYWYVSMLLNNIRDTTDFVDSGTILVLDDEDFVNFMKLVRGNRTKDGYGLF